MSCYRDLNPGPLPYQGSALPLSYNSKKKRAEDGAQTRDPQLGRLMLYQLSYFRILAKVVTLILPHSCQSCHSDRGQRWIRTTEGVSQQIYSLPHLATLVFALKQVENVELKVESEFFPSQFSLLFSIEVSNFAWNSQFSILNFPLL